MSTTAWIIIGILAYAAFMVWHGFSNFRQTSKSAESFFNADRGVSSFVLVCTTAISVFSGLTYYGYPSSMYRFGIGYFTGTGCGVIALCFCTIGFRLWVLGKEYGFQTPSDYLRSRYYSEGFGLFVAVLLTIFIIPYTTLQLITIGDGISTTTNGAFPYMLAVLFGTVCVSLHIIGGGMKSVAWLDTFHLILGFAAVYVLVIVIVMKYFPDGGLVEAANIVANGDRASVFTVPGPTGAYTWKAMLNLAITGAVATIVWPHIFMRCYIAQGTKNFKVMAVALPLVYGFVFVGLVILGLIIAPALLGPDFADPDTIVPTLATKYCPPIVSFISLLCIFAFAVSTSDSMLLSASAMASRDIYGRWKYELKGKAVEPKKTVFFARVILVIMMIICILISMFKPTYITDYAYSLCSPFFAMIMPCTIGGLWWKRGTKEGAWAGTVAGLIVVFLLTFFITPPLGFSALVWGLVVNTVLYIVVSLCTKCPEEVVDKYITRIGSIINCSTELKEKTGSALKAARMSSVNNAPMAVPAMA